ncbi:MAG: ASCH domain-containing protein [Cellulomonas sp.]|nr:ASCH domain-containing protein [Cellulomonas sp.]
MSNEAQEPGTPADDELAARIVTFWQAGRQRLGMGDLAPVMGTDASDSLVPTTWTFADADAAVESILAGRKRATSAVLADLADVGSEGVPARGDVAIVLDSDRNPRALVQAEEVRTVRMAEVDEAHAAAELGVERSAQALVEWHEHNDAGVSDPAVQLLLERFTLIYPGPRS